MLVTHMLVSGLSLQLLTCEHESAAQATKADKALVSMTDLTLEPFQHRISSGGSIEISLEEAEVTPACSRPHHISTPHHVCLCTCMHASTND
eukprot:1161590-Pelagomonas_calceolata.AAC.6